MSESSGCVIYCTEVKRLAINPLTAGAAYIRVFIFY